MEKHHKLRRPPGSSIHGCNICGKEGHQAAVCPNGTVDWASKWPKEAFTLDDPKHHVEPDYKHVERVAKEWVAAKRKKLAAANAPPSQAGDEGQPAGAAPQAHVWATFLDPLNRPYYHCAALNKTVWTLAETQQEQPPPAQPAVAAAAEPAAAPVPG